ncbi:MAG: polysaccharide biosynthesis tyrosine autokinase [Geminicoccaceae bacterium]|nr:polysaccharide biosynthesis tyrosine autokinase [Geminicoccaceae bacterium]
MANPEIARAGSAQTAAPEPGGVDVKELVAILRRRRSVIAGTVLVLTSLALLVGFQITPKFTAKALVMIDPRQAKVVDLQAVLQGLGTDASTVETQIKILKSRNHVEQVMEDLRLFDDPEFNRHVDGGSSVVRLPLGGVLETLVSWLPDEWLIASGLAEEPRPPEEGPSELVREAAIERFDDRYKVTQEGRSYVIGVSFASTDPRKAAQIANRAAELYVEGQRRLKLDATVRATDFLGSRLDELKADVQRAEAAVAEFRKQHKLVDAKGATLNESQLADISRELITARSALAETQAKLRLVKDLRDRGGDELASVADVLQSPVIVDLRRQEAQLLREESELRTFYGERHPKMLNLVNEKANLQAKVRTEVDRIIKNLENDVKVASARVAALERETAALSAQTAGQRELDVQLRQLEREAQASRQLYESFLQRFKETSEQKGIIESDARVIQVASPPEKPSSPGPVLFGAVGFIASLMLGTLLALLLERLDSGLRTARQVETHLGIPALGLVPRVDRLKRRQKPHQYLLAKPLSAYAESIRAIFTSLKLSNVDDPPKVVLVTSSLPQEGKTTLALSLATFAARSSQRVLLLDLDLRHPSIHRDLGIEPRIGFIELMAGEASLADVIVHDEETDIDLLPVKKQTANPTDILGSNKMVSLIAELRSRYDFVVIDSAPLLGVTDTKVASLLADKVLFITQWEKTNVETARNGLSHLFEAKASVAGAVLTQVDIKKHATYGYGDVGQYYGKYQRYYVN